MKTNTTSDYVYDDSSDQDVNVIDLFLFEDESSFGGADCAGH